MNCFDGDGRARQATDTGGVALKLLVGCPAMYPRFFSPQTLKTTPFFSHPR
jgi:hypothetical protein